MSRVKLTDRRWRPFKIKQLFKIVKGNANQLTYRHPSTSAYALPLITSSKLNNSISMFTIPKSTDIIYHNCLTINNSGSVGYSFYHPYKFIASGHATVLIPIGFKLNSSVALYLTSLIQKQRSKFNFGYAINNKRLKNLKILLPVNKHNQPDYRFMTDYIKSRNVKLNTHHWGHFKIKQIAKINSGTRYKKSKQIKGRIPYVNSSGINNGVTNFITSTPNTPKSFYSNVISVNATGSIGCTFYHPYIAYFADGANVLSNRHFNKFNALFVCACIKHQIKQFNYGFTLYQNRLSNLVISLPIDKHNQPDWEYMTNYIKARIPKLR